MESDIPRTSKVVRGFAPDQLLICNEFFNKLDQTGGHGRALKQHIESA